MFGLRKQCGAFVREFRRGLSDRKRFYKDVNVVSSGSGNGYDFEVTLDGRKLKTPGGQTFRVRSEALAQAVTVEWLSQKSKILSSQMHLTGLVNTSLDNPSRSDANSLVKEISQFLETDTIFFFSSEPEGLLHLQEARWRPLIEWFNARYGLGLTPTPDSSNILGRPVLPKKDLLTIQRHLLTYPFEALNGILFATEALKSLVITMAVIDNKLRVDEAVQLARLELQYQTDRWGNVEWAHDIELHDTTSRLAAAVLFVNAHTNIHTSKEKFISS